MPRSRILAVAVLAFWSGVSFAAGTIEDYQRADALQERCRGLVLNKEIRPTWFAGGGKFWYRKELADGGKRFMVVDAEAAVVRPAFDHAKLAGALREIAGGQHSGEKLPFDWIDLVDDCNSVEFEVDNGRYRCDLRTYRCEKTGEATRPQLRGDAQGRRPRTDSRRPDTGRFLSPDGCWEALIREHNLYIRATQDSREFRLSHDGEPNHSYSRPVWSPDSNAVVAHRTQDGDHKLVYVIESSPKEGGRAVMRSYPYDLPGDKLDTFEMRLFDVRTKEQTRIDVEPVDFEGPPRLRWAPDGGSFTFSKTDRGHQRVRVFRVDVRAGDVHTLIDERSDTFINQWWDGGVDPRYLDKSREIIWPSERHGYRHLYLYDGQAGGLKNRITKGRWVVRGYGQIDEAARTIEFMASGRRKDRDPYLIQYYRVNFDGTGMVCMTPGHGNHRVQFSPDRRYLIDTYSRVDMPPVHELRRAADGKLICRLGKADASALYAIGWRAPEPFVAKGRDGQTDIFGIIHRPMNLDESKKYPVIEDIYAGPHGSFVPKSWSDYHGAQSLAELGFIVVQIDGMGTNNRSKAFHDVCWKNLGDSGFPDRIAWIRSAAEKHSYMDLTRVGIYGTSAGGQSAARGVLAFGDFYKAAVASCGCHDNRMDKASWNEQWMGYPVGPHYEEQSNITQAHRLTGRLLLMVGELDNNVPPESTYRLVDALIKAKKEFELVVLPGQGHTSGGEYGQRKRRDFFVKHLQGVDPPNWNAIGADTR